MTLENDDLFEHARSALQAQDEPLAIAQFEELSKRGDWRGSYMVGYVLAAKGGPDTSRYTTAAEWYAKALTQKEHHLPRFELAQFYYYGLGGKYDFEKAYEHLTHCVDYHPVAMMMMGELLFLGLGCGKDVEAARRRFTSAAAEGFPAALIGLSRIEKSQKRFVRSTSLRFRALTLAIKLVLQDRNHPLLTGIGGKRGAIRLDGVDAETTLMRRT